LIFCCCCCCCSVLIFPRFCFSGLSIESTFLLPPPTIHKSVSIYLYLWLYSHRYWLSAKLSIAAYWQIYIHTYSYTSICMCMCMCTSDTHIHCHTWAFIVSGQLIPPYSFVAFVVSTFSIANFTLIYILQTRNLYRYTHTHTHIDIHNIFYCKLCSWPSKLPHSWITSCHAYFNFDIFGIPMNRNTKKKRVLNILIRKILI